MNPVFSLGERVLGLIHREIKPSSEMNSGSYSPMSNSLMRAVAPDLLHKTNSSDQILINSNLETLERIRSLRLECEGGIGDFLRIASCSMQIVAAVLFTTNSDNSIQDLQAQVQGSLTDLRSQASQYGERVLALLRGDARRFNQLGQAADEQENDALNNAVSLCDEALRNIRPSQQPELYRRFTQERESLRDSASKIELAGIIRGHSIFFARTWQESITGFLGAAAAFGSGILALATRNLFFSSLLAGVGSGAFQVALQLLVYKQEHAFESREDYQKLIQSILVGAICAGVGYSVGCGFEFCMANFGLAVIEREGSKFFANVALRGLQVCVSKGSDVLTEVLADDALSPVLSGQRNISNRLGLHAAPVNEQRFIWKLFNNCMGEVLGDRWNEGLQHHVISGTRLDWVHRIQSRRQQEALHESVQLYIHENAEFSPQQNHSSLLSSLRAAVASNDNAFERPDFLNQIPANDTSAWWIPREQKLPQILHFQATGTEGGLSSTPSLNGFEIPRAGNLAGSVEIRTGQPSHADVVYVERESHPPITEIPRNYNYREMLNEQMRKILLSDSPRLRKSLPRLPCDYPVFQKIAATEDPLRAMNLYLSGQFDGHIPTHDEMTAFTDMSSGGAVMAQVIASYGMIPIYQIYTREFIESYSAKLLALCAFFELRYSRPPVILDVSNRVSGLSRLLGSQFFPYDIHHKGEKDIQEVDIFLSSWMESGDLSGSDLLKYLGEHPSKYWLDIGDADLVHDDAFYKELSRVQKHTLLASQAKMLELKKSNSSLCFSFQSLEGGKDQSGVSLYASPKAPLPQKEFTRISDQKNRLPQVQQSSKRRESDPNLRLVKMNEQIYFSEIREESFREWKTKYLRLPHVSEWNQNQVSDFLTRCLFSHSEVDQQAWQDFMNRADSEALELALKLLCRREGLISCSLNNAPILYDLLHQLSLKGLTHKVGLFYFKRDNGSSEGELALVLGDAEKIHSHFLNYYCQRERIQFTELADNHTLAAGVANVLPSVDLNCKNPIEANSDLDGLYAEYLRILGSNVKGDLPDLHKPYDIVRTRTTPYGTSQYVLHWREGDCCISIYSALKDEARQNLAPFYDRVSQIYKWAQARGVRVEIYEYPKELKVVEGFMCPGRLDERDSGPPVQVFLGDKLFPNPLAIRVSRENYRFKSIGRENLDVLREAIYAKYQELVDVSNPYRKLHIKSIHDELMVLKHRLRNVLRFEDRVDLESQIYLTEEYLATLSAS